MSYLEELLPNFRKGAKIRCSDWGEGYYIKKSGDYVVDRNGDKYFIHPCKLTSDTWEFYSEPELDYDYIIKNKCMCWFWDEGDEDNKFINVLCDMPSGKHSFVTEQDSLKVGFNHCRPVRRDEVTFYEDIKDENK